MKRLSLFIVLMTFAVSMLAVPARRGLWKTLTLQDGTQVRATLVGDEHGHFWKAEDGKTYTQQGNVYVAVDAQQIIQRAKARRTKVNAQRAKRLAQRRIGEVGSYTGKKKAIVLLVNFKDQKFETGHDNALFNRIANEEGFSEGNFKGSMADYFKAQSRGKFELDFDVVGPVTVSQNASYYGKNVTVEGSDEEQDKCPAEMVIEAVNLAKKQVSDWTSYDWDNDGYVDQVYVIYAGKGEADPGYDDMSDAIWPHAYSLYAANYYGKGSGPVTVGNNLEVDGYACGSELNGDGDICGIGTMCHEYSHCLGYPDFYDIDYSGGQGMGNYDLMCSGSYNGNGYQPAGYTSYELWMAGWQEPIELDAEDVAVTDMKSLQKGGESYIIYNKGNKNEYMMLENRQKEGWDASLPDNGLLILHCDYSAKVWEENGPNDDPDHQRMTVVPADGEYAYEEYEDGEKNYYDATLFPYESVTAFNKNFKVKSNDKVAKKAAQFFTKNTNGTYWIDGSVENITQNSDKTISFNFVANYDDAPAGEALPLPFTETFDQCKGTGGNDDKWSGNGVASKAADFISDNEGWTEANDKYYGGNKCARFGTGDSAGEVSTPVLVINGTAKLSFKAGAWNNNKAGTSLSLVVKGGTIDKGSVILTKGAWNDYEANITAAGNATITFTQSKGAFFLDEVKVISTSTGIKDVKAVTTTTTRIYTIDGRYVGTDPNQLPRGLYVVNGKKIVK